MIRFGILISLAMISAWKGDNPSQTCIDKLKAAKSLTVTMQVTFPSGKPQTWQVQFLKPNLYVITSPDQEFRSDGKAETVYLPATHQYQTTDRKSDQIVDAPFAFGLGPFFPGNVPLPGGAAEQAQLDKKPVLKLNVREPGFESDTIVYLDPQTDLPIGYDEPMGPGKSLLVRYSDLKLDDPLKPDQFAWSPPADAKPLRSNDLAANLLAPDSQAPSPTLKNIGGAAIDLASEFHTHRSTVLYFWNGPPPIPDAASLKDLYAQLQAQRFQLVLVDFNAPDSALKDLQSAQFPFPVVLDDKVSSLAKAYGVQSQAEFIVGQDGKVGPHFLGYDPDGLTRALRQRGFRT